MQIARTFIVNYFEGSKIEAKNFDTTETTPELCPTGVRDAKWEALRAEKPNLWVDEGLREAGKEFASLVKAQRAAFVKSTKKRRLTTRKNQPILPS